MEIPHLRILNTMLQLNRRKYSNLTDEELLVKYKAKPSRVLFGEIYRRYGHLVFGTTLKYLKNKQDAEDITMNIFVKIKEKMIEHNIQHLSSWIYMVTKNECLMTLRKKDHATIDLSLEQKSEPEIDDDVFLQKEVQFELLEQAINELKEVQSVCIRLFYLEQKSYQEISTKLNIELKKVKSAIQNGKRNIRINLERNHEFRSAK